jgi:hypothetical protein
MKTSRRWLGACSAGFGLALGALTGCQTWVPQAGMTLPSGHYLQHPPQYFPVSPPFPLPRELAYQESVAAQAEAAHAGGAGALPNPVVPPVGGAVPAAPPPGTPFGGPPAAAPVPAPPPPPGM